MPSTSRSTSDRLICPLYQATISQRGVPRSVASILKSLGLRFVAMDMALGTQKTINRRDEERDHHCRRKHDDLQDLIYSVDERIATITLNRPDRMNALSRNLEDELHQAFDEADTDPDVRVHHPDRQWARILFGP